MAHGILIRAPASFILDDNVAYRVALLLLVGALNFAKIVIHIREDGLFRAVLEDDLWLVPRPLLARLRPTALCR